MTMIMVGSILVVAAVAAVVTQNAINHCNVYTRNARNPFGMSQSVGL